MKKFLLAAIVIAGMARAPQCAWAQESREPLRSGASASEALSFLKKECDDPKMSNGCEWTSYCSATELARFRCIKQLKSLGDEAQGEARREMVAAKGEYKQMLTVTLAAFGDSTSIWQAGQLMLHARLPAVRVCAAMELSRRKDSRMLEPFKLALADGFKRRDGSCVSHGMIYPVRLIASDALVDLGMSLEDVRKIGLWWEQP